MERKPEILTFDKMTSLLTQFVDEQNDNFLLNKDLSILFNFAPGVIMATQHHMLIQTQDYRCGIVRQGHGKVKINLVETQLSTGDIIFITPGTIIEPLSYSDDLEMSGIALSPEMAHLALNNHLPPIYNGEKKSGKITVDQHVADTIKTMHQMIYDMVKISGANSQVVLHLIAAHINLYNDLFVAQQQLISAQSSNEQQLLERFIYLVNHHSKQEHQLAFYAEKMCITQRYLGSVIRKASGSSAKEWIDRSLITQAKLLLNYEKMTVAQIADELNFANASFFCKYFKRLTGKTPQEYKGQTGGQVTV